MLQFIDLETPGITRKKVRNGWGYIDPTGNRITDRDEIDRLNKIALPPAYRDAWFASTPDAHIQAIGYDERGRRQYRYHLDFRAAQDAAKYDRCADFGHALPRLRKQVEEDLAHRANSREAVIAAVVRLLDLGRIRVGNETYAKDNKSFGATTLRNRHVKVKGGKLNLQYRAKSGVMRRLTISDKSLLRVVRRVQDLPGQNLFQWLDLDGTPHPVGSADVNDYIRDHMRGEFTAKHFRTWAASVIALEHMATAAREGTKVKLKELLEPVANTPTMARKSYVHPQVLALVGDGYTAKLPRPTRWLSAAERGLLTLLNPPSVEAALTDPVAATVLVEPEAATADAA